MPWHTEVDGYSRKHSNKKVKSVQQKGIGPTYTDEMRRIALKVGDLYSPEALAGKQIGVVNFTSFKNKQLKRIIVTLKTLH